MERDCIAKIRQHAFAGDDGELEGVHDGWVENSCVTGLAENGYSLEHGGNFNKEEMGDEDERVVESRMVGFIGTKMSDMQY